MIYEESKKLFAEKGYENTSMRDIAVACGMSLGNINYHYKKKEDLLMSSHRKFIESFYQQHAFHRLKDENP